jgi:hypothetical protein
MDTMAGEVIVRCTDCDRELEACSFCDEVDCGHALCYRCVALTVGSEITEPHVHGG